MATYLNRSNFNGSAGSHFFLDLYYDVLSASSVRFYAYIGSVDGYSAGGTSSAVYINGSHVGSISNIPARSNTLIGYLDVSGSGVVTATASCSTPWNGVGSASVSGSVSVGPFITSFTVSKRDETSVQFNWSASSAADYGWYSFDNVNWYDLPTSNVIGGLVPGQPYNFYLRLRQASTQALYVAGPVQQSPYNYPSVSSKPNFTIGNQVTIGLDNPLNRSCTVYMIGDNGTTWSGDTVTGSSVVGYNNSTWINRWYSSIPNKPSGTYKVRLVVSSLGRDTTVTGGTYSITGNEKPTVTTTAIDTGKTLDNGNVTTTLTGDNKKIIKYISDVKVDVTATAQNSATITSVTTKYGTQAEISGSSHTYTNVENATFKGYAKDSRGLTNNSTASGLTLINYIKLTLEDVELYRDNQTSDTLKCKGGGNYFTGSFGAMNNSLSFKLRYKESSVPSWEGITWTTKTMTIGTNSYSFDFTVGTNFDYTKTYDFQFEVADKCITITDNEVAKAGLPVQGLFESFHEAFGVKTFEKTSDGTKLNNNVLEKVVWTNPNISNDFPATTITLTDDDLDNYSHYSILFTGRESGTYVSTGKIPLELDTMLQLALSQASGNQVHVRKVTVSKPDNSFTISRAYNYASQNDITAKPYKIILYR